MRCPQAGRGKAGTKPKGAKRQCGALCRAAPGVPRSCVTLWESAPWSLFQNGALWRSAPWSPRSCVTLWRSAPGSLVQNRAFWRCTPWMPRSWITLLECEPWLSPEKRGLLRWAPRAVRNRTANPSSCSCFAPGDGGVRWPEPCARRPPAMSTGVPPRADLEWRVHSGARSNEQRANWANAAQHPRKPGWPQGPVEQQNVLRTVCVTGIVDLRRAFWEPDPAKAYASLQLRQSSACAGEDGSHDNASFYRCSCCAYGVLRWFPGFLAFPPHVHHGPAGRGCAR